MISNNLSTVYHRGNAVTTVFTIPFKFLDADDLQVTLVNLLTVTSSIIAPSNYTVIGAGEETGGTLTYAPDGLPITADYALFIERRIAFTQLLNLQVNSGFLPEAIEAQLDRIVMMVQQLQGQFTKAETVPNYPNVVTGPVASAVNNIPVFNSTGGQLIKDSGKSLADYADVSHTHNYSDLTNSPETVSGLNLTDFDENVMAAVADAISNGTQSNITVNYSSGDNSLSFAATQSKWTELIQNVTQDIVSNVTLTSSDILQFPVEASANYLVEFDVYLLSPSAVGYKFGFTGPASPTILIADCRIQDNTPTQTLQCKIAYGSINSNTPAADKYIHIKGNVIIHNGANTAVFALQFAQNVSSATATKIYAGSTLRYTKLEN